VNNFAYTATSSPISFPQGLAVEAHRGQQSLGPEKKSLGLDEEVAKFQDFLLIIVLL